MATVTQSTATPQHVATLDDLYRVEGKAELIGGRIVVEEMATGFRPGEVACNIYFSLRTHGRQTKTGFATPDNVGYGVPKLPSGRESFNPDAGFFTGALPANLMRFIFGPPTLAVEVRSEFDYGTSAEEQLAAKRAEYFLAGNPDRLGCRSPGGNGDRLPRFGPDRSSDLAPRRNRGCGTGGSRLANHLG